MRIPPAFTTTETEQGVIDVATQGPERGPGELAGKVRSPLRPHVGPDDWAVTTINDRGQCEDDAAAKAIFDSRSTQTLSKALVCSICFLQELCKSRSGPGG